MVCQLGLTGRLLLNERRDEVTDRFELMTMCPRQHKRDIIAQTSRLRVLRCHTPRLSQELSPWLLVTSENVSRHQCSTWSRTLPCILSDEHVERTRRGIRPHATGDSARAHAS